MSDKLDFIDAYFESWDDRLDRAAVLIANQSYYEEGLLVLSCYLGAFAAMRYPNLKDGEAYTKIVLEYSGLKEFYRQIDLLFLYQWPRSKLHDNGNYRDFINYQEIAVALKQIYGDEEAVKEKNRYVEPEELITHVLDAAIPCFDEKNFRQKLPLFSLAELLYRYLRCDAVHNASFPFVIKARTLNRNVNYKENHEITGQVLLKTIKGVRNALWEECRYNSKWPQEL